jgi:ribosome biogenesis protein ERB1
VGDLVVLLDPHAEVSADVRKPAAEASAVSDAASGGDCSSWDDKDGLVFIKHSGNVSKLSWHHKGDYFATLIQGGSGVFIHRVAERSSRRVFNRQKVPIRNVQFHPNLPVMFAQTSAYVYSYDLRRQTLVKKLVGGGNTMSCFATHSSGDHVLVGASDGKTQWFDLDLSQAPYKVMQSHATGVRSVAFHRKLPLFATASDDCTIHVLHCGVSHDLNQNVLIVPLKILRGHASHDVEGVIDCCFHPTQPWLFSAGADSTIALYCDEN